MRVRAWPVAATILVLLVSLGAVLTWLRPGHSGCRTDLGEPDWAEGLTVERRTADDLSEPPDVDDIGRQEYQEAVEALEIQPDVVAVGELEVFYPGTYGDSRTWNSPTPIGLWDDTLVVLSSGQWLGTTWRQESTLIAVDLSADGAPLWVSAFEGRKADVSPTGETLTTWAIPRDRAPEAMGIHPENGEVAWCQSIGPNDDTVSRATVTGSPTSDGDLVVSRFLTGDDGWAPGATTARLDAGTGDVLWEVTEDAPEFVGRQATAVDLIIQSLREDGGPQPTVRYGRGEELPVLTAPVVARHVDDGSRAWIYAPETEEHGTIDHYLIGTTDDRVILAQGRVETDPPGSHNINDTIEQGLIVALDHAGEVAWETEIPFDQLRWADEGFIMTDELLIDRTGESIRAWSLDDGAVAWNATDVDGRPAHGVVVDDRLLVPGIGSLTEVDLNDGTSRPVLRDGVSADPVLVSEDRIVMATRAGLAVFTRNV
jgi:hypothetical protein